MPKSEDFVVEDGVLVEYCGKDRNIVVPEGVKMIDYGVFKALTPDNFDSLSLPDSLEDVGLGMFGFSEEESIAENYKDENGFIIIDGWLVDYRNEKDRNIVIPEGVKRISSGAFNELTPDKFDSLSLPSSLEVFSLEVFDFDERDGIAEKLKDENGLIMIGSWLIGFRGDQDTITLPRQIRHICQGAFDVFDNGCTVKKVILNEGIEEIGEEAFCHSDVETVVLPSSLKRIAARAFWKCDKLTKIEVLDSVQVDPTAFLTCSGLTDDRGLLIVDGKLIALHVRKNVQYFMSDTDDFILTLPADVVEVCDISLNDLNYGFESLTGLIVTDCLKTIDPKAFSYISGIQCFRIVDHVTGQTLYETAYGDKEDQYSVDEDADFVSRCKDIMHGIQKNGTTHSGQTFKSPSQLILSGNAPITTPSDELYGHYGKLRRAAEPFKNLNNTKYVQSNGKEFEALILTLLLKNRGDDDTSVYNCLEEFEKGDKYSLHETALKMSQVFRVNKAVYDARHDDEGDIHDRLMDKKWKLSALRSFAWTLAELADRAKKSIDDFSLNELLHICDFIQEREYLNYEDGSWFNGLCGHPDCHVFYMPESMIQNGQADEICDVFGYSPIVSLDALRNDLYLLKNAMVVLHNGLLKDRDRNQKLDSTAAAVLQAWCVMAVSAKQPYFSEDGPTMFTHNYPQTALNNKPLTVGAHTEPLKKSEPKAKTEETTAGSVEKYVVTRGTDGKGHVMLGEYPAGSPVKWLLLEKQGEELLLLSEYALDAQPYDSSTNEWYESSLRKWLNEEFFAEAFSEDEQGMILSDTHEMYTKSSGNETAGKPATDKVFLLSAKEVRKYFPKDKDMICKASAYAKKQGAEIEAGPNQCHWWLRCPPVSMLGLPSWAPCVRATAEIKGWGIYSREIGIRPVIRVKSDKIVFSEGAEGSDILFSEKNSKPEAKKKTASKNDKSKPHQEDTASQTKGKKPKSSAANSAPASVASGERVFDNVEAVLAPGYQVKRTIDEDDGQEFITIGKAPKKKTGDDDFDACVDLERPVLIDNRYKRIGSPVETLRKMAADGKDNAWLVVPGDLPFSLHMKTEEKEIFLAVLHSKTVECKVLLSDNRLFVVSALTAQANRDPDENDIADMYKRFFEGLKMIRVEGKSIELPESSVALRRRLDAGEKTTIGKSSASNSASSKAQPTKKETSTKPATPTQMSPKPASNSAGKTFKTAKGILQKYHGNEERVIVPDGVTAIGKEAFYNNKTVRSVVMPQSLREIHEWAFHYCTNLETVELHDNVEHIAHTAFFDCESLSSFVLPGNVAFLNISFSDSKNLRWLVLHKNVDIIGDGFTLPKGVTVYGELPEGIKGLREKLIKAGCILKEHELPHGIQKPVCTLTQEQRYNQHFQIEKDELTKVRFDEFISLDNQAHSECGSIAFPQGVHKMNRHAFDTGFGEGKHHLREIVFPNSMKDIDCDFHNVIGLEGVEVPYGVQGLAVQFGTYFVSDCKSLRYITLPNTIKKIGIRAIQNCPQLTSINIPRSVESIHKDCLSGCPKVTVYGERGTKAEEFARSKGIPFRVGLPQGVPTPRVENDTRPVQREAQIRRAEIAKISAKLAEKDRARLEQERQRQQEEARRRAALEQQRLESERRAQEARQRAEEQRRREAEIAQLNAEKQQLLLVIEQNQGGLFGEKARNRRQAKARLAEIESRLKNLM